MSYKNTDEPNVLTSQHIVIDAPETGTSPGFRGKDIPFRFLATDFDGTLWGSQADRQFQSAFAERIRLLQANGVKWCVATGRGKRSFKRMFYPLKILGLQPDYLIIENAYIYSPGRFMDYGHPLWNIHIRNIQKGEMEAARKSLTVAFHRIREDYPTSKILIAERDRLDIRLPSADDAHAACAQLRAQLRSSRMLMVLQYGVELRMRRVPFTKGLAIAEIAENIGLSRDDVLAVGDGLNDISMLDRSVARYVGCPSNAADEVVEHVHNRGGHISGKGSLEGVVAVLDAYLSGEVDSTLPSSLVPAFLRERKSSGSGRRHNPDELSDSRTFFIMGGIGYAVLAVLAHFSLIPFSKQILFPVRLLHSAVEMLLKGTV